MLKKIIHNSKIWSILKTVLTGITALLLLFSLLLFFYPTANNIDELTISAEPLSTAALLTLPDPNVFSNLNKSMRRGLFKSASMINSKPVADKTIERIVQKLKLQCVMNIGKQPIAYIKTSDKSMKKCKIGDSVENMFTVLDIRKNSVDISIIGHKVTLTK